MQLGGVMNTSMNLNEKADRFYYVYSLVKVYSLLSFTC